MCTSYWPSSYARCPTFLLPPLHWERFSTLGLPTSSTRFPAKIGRKSRSSRVLQNLLASEPPQSSAGRRLTSTHHGLAVVFSPWRRNTTFLLLAGECPPASTLSSRELCATRLVRKRRTATPSSTGRQATRRTTRKISAGSCYSCKSTASPSPKRKMLLSTMLTPLSSTFLQAQLASSYRWSTNSVSKRLSA